MDSTNEVVVKEVEAIRGVLAEIVSHFRQEGIRTLPVELAEPAIPWVAKELHPKERSDLTLEQFTLDFRRELVNGCRRGSIAWKYSADRGRGHVGVMLMPKEKTKFFEIVADERGERILKFRYIEYT